MLAKFSFVSFLLIAQLCFAQAQYGESWISPEGLFPANHGATLAELPEGKTLVCWYAGSREGGPDVQIYCSQKDKTSTVWSKPAVAVAAGERASGAWLKNKTVGNPSLFLDPQGVLWLFYTSIQIGGWAGGKVDYKVSKDFGQTWSEGKRLIDDFGNLTRTKPILLSSDPVVFMLPLYHELFKKNGYTCNLEVNAGEIKNFTCHEVPGDEHFQPSIVNFKNKIYAYFRDFNKNAVFTAEFDLQKQEWSMPVATNLPNPNSSVESLVYKNQVLLIYNNSNAERAPLSLAVSSDGILFKHLHDFEPFGVNREFSYPAFIQSSDGLFHLAYTYERRVGIKYIQFNEDWLSSINSMLKH